MSNLDPSKVKAVVFDIGGVIIPSPVPVLKEFESRSGLPKGTLEGLIVHGGRESAWGKLETGKRTFTQFLSDFGTEIQQKTGRSVDMTLFQNLFAERTRQPFPQLVDAIHCLHAEGYKLALLTNNWFVEGTITGINTLELDLSLFNVIIESACVGVRKPYPQIYHICQERLGVQPREIVFLDDLGNNLKAARQVGWYTIKVTSADKAVHDLEAALGLQLRGFVEGTLSVPKHLDLNLQRLAQYMNKTLGLSSTELPVVKTFEHGQSNPTYLVQYGGKKVVLRKKPPGTLLPSAHAVDREYRVMKAVGENGVPVPQMLSYCNDESVLGTPFYVMEYLPGGVFKIPRNMAVSPEEVRALYFNMVDVLCKLHSIDISKAGLDTYGRKGNFIQRNFQRWSKQYEASKTGDIPSITSLMNWIPQHYPQEERVTVIHGDFRLDNLMFAKTSTDILGVLDWELSTLGDPITDLTTCCLAHYLPQSATIVSGLVGADLKSMGIPTVQELIGRYCHQMKIPPIENWDFYMAFTFFKMAAILQGVYKRSISGQGSSSQGRHAGAAAKRYADLGWRIASGSKLKPTLRTVNSEAEQRRNLLKTQTIMSYISRPMAVDRTQETVGQMPVSVDALSPRVQDLYNRMKRFLADHVAPIEKEVFDYLHGPNRWTVHPKLTQITQKAKAEGLWNMFMPLESDPERKYGSGLTNLEYAFFCEEMGRVPLAPSIFNCNAPDTGNMEVLVKYGTEEQKQKWLTPLLNGQIRSCFGMTEPEVASSDATNIQSSIRRDGDSYVINGHKWWTSNALHPDCKLCVFMGKTSTSGSRYRQQSMILVPMDAPGVKVVRSLSVFGYDHAPGGHGEVLFENVRVPASNMLLGEGRGFEIAQGRLGPGRIHHCMRLIGNAERALSFMIERTKSRIAFGKPLAAQGTIQANIAQSRIEIEQTRLLVLKAAYMMDLYGNKVAAPDIAMIKVAAPSMALRVVDRAMQAHGGAGVSEDFPLASMFAQVRTLRFADGPDEVHERSVARMEYA
ncbi:LOW QUALITY PROTEIN: acyl-CoA dehydrogenase family member 10-like [Haliotis rubra]|uniref:LOW QUALITY PROTEIN: acyl-CoA dehydrogenase family member 10-like n=1 Tax=Haliotis rubra TaxID=36100 RepID=UPI001EE5A535|nr:LOW QUALITY PROTEIN: acyl-CoA dehydrogenase family member 10-like [Haliotis rubra]